MRLMRLVPIYQAPNTSKKHPEHKVYPYLLRKLPIKSWSWFFDHLCGMNKVDFG